MGAVVADAAGDAAGGFVDGRVKVAPVRVVVAIAAFASVCLAANGRPPGQVVVEILALLAVESLGVVRALAPSVHHVRPLVDGRQGQAARGVAVTRAGPSNHHVVDGVVVLVLDLLPVNKRLVELDQRI